MFGQLNVQTGDGRRQRGIGSRWRDGDDTDSCHRTPVTIPVARHPDPAISAGYDLRRLRRCRACAPRVKGEPRMDVILLSHYDILEPFPFADDSIHSTFPFLTQKNSG